jgi:hypothetical protein
MSNELGAGVIGTGGFEYVRVKWLRLCQCVGGSALCQENRRRIPGRRNSSDHLNRVDCVGKIMLKFDAYCKDDENIEMYDAKQNCSMKVTNPL